MRKLMMSVIYIFIAFLSLVFLSIIASDLTSSEKISTILMLASITILPYLGIRYMRYLKRQQAIRIAEEIRINEERQKQQEEYIQKVYEEVENNLQPIETNIKLTRNEEVFFKLDNVNWQELRKERTSISYAGLSQTITIAKGLRFKVGNIKPVQHSYDTIKTIETGTLYLTNKNILLISEYASKKIDLKKIVDTSIYSDTIKIQRQTGKAVFLPMNFENIVRFSIILDKCLA
ncbi:MAG: hypothetical protein ACRC9L_07450 [Brevinema sp.]